MKLLCVHLLSQPSDQREQRSVAQLSQLPKRGIARIESVNPPWTGDLPPCRESHDRPFIPSKGQYGCWKAHRDAIIALLWNVDALLVCECDCLPTGSMDEFVRKVNRAAEACIEFNLDAFTLGYKHGAQILEKHGDVMLISQWIGTHAYVIPMKSRQLFLDMFALPWDAFDFCVTCYLLDQQHRRIGAFSHGPAAIQADGKSLVSGEMSTAENYYRHVRH